MGNFWEQKWVNLKYVTIYLNFNPFWEYYQSNSTTFKGTCSIQLRNIPNLGDQETKRAENEGNKVSVQLLENE